MAGDRNRADTVVGANLNVYLSKQLEGICLLTRTQRMRTQHFRHPCGSSRLQDARRRPAELQTHGLQATSLCKHMLAGVCAAGVCTAVKGQHALAADSPQLQLVTLPARKAKGEAHAPTDPRLLKKAGTSTNRTARPRVKNIVCAQLCTLPSEPESWVGADERRGRWIRC